MRAPRQLLPWRHSPKRKAPRTGLEFRAGGLGGWGLGPVQIANTGNYAKFLCDETRYSGDIPPWSRVHQKT